MRPAEELAQLWAAEELDVRAIEAVSTSAWKTYQLVYFLDKILQKSPLPPGEKKWVVSSRLEGDRLVTLFPGGCGAWEGGWTEAWGKERVGGGMQVPARVPGGGKS